MDCLRSQIVVVLPLEYNSRQKRPTLARFLPFQRLFLMGLNTLFIELFSIAGPSSDYLCGYIPDSMVAGVGNAPTNNWFMRPICDFRISLPNSFSARNDTRHLLHFLWWVSSNYSRIITHGEVTIGAFALPQPIRDWATQRASRLSASIKYRDLWRISTSPSVSWVRPVFIQRTVFCVWLGE